MTNLNRIVVALDLEAGSDTVLARAIQLAAAHAARLLILHVIKAEALPQAAALTGRSESTLQEDFRQQALSTIDALAAESMRAQLADVQIMFGTPHENITRIADEQRADVILIGPGRRRSLKEKVLGSTADRVIRTAGMPVLVVRTHSSEPYRKVVAAIDFSPQSAAAVEQACKLAPEAAMQFIHVVEVPSTFEQAMLRAGTSQIERQQYRSARHAKASQDLAEFVRTIVGARKVSTRVVDGEPGLALVRLSRSSQVDLVAMGPNGRGVVRQALLGSVTQRVLKEAGCDILVANGQ